MKTIARNLSFLFLLTACGQENIEYLYNESDPEYKEYVKLAKQDCINKSPIFNELDKTSNFEIFSTNSIFKITKDDKKFYFAKIKSTSSDKIEIALATEDERDNTILSFSKEDNKKLLETVSNGVCNKGTNYSVLGGKDALKGTNVLKFKSSVKATDGNSTQEYTLDKSMPLVLSSFSLIINEEVKKGNNKSNNYKDSYKISKISEKDCKEDDICNEVFNVSGSECSPKINNEHPTTTNYKLKLIDLKDCGVNI